jgi:hypothetical protein
MTATYTLTRRHDNATLETGIAGYLAALSKLDAYPSVDVIIHEDGTDWMADREKQEPYDYTQGGWAYL